MKTLKIDWNLQPWEEIEIFGATQSTEPERLQEQRNANRRRLAAYRGKLCALMVAYLDGNIPIDKIPRHLRPALLQEQAD